MNFVVNVKERLDVLGEFSHSSADFRKVRRIFFSCSTSDTAKEFTNSATDFTKYISALFNLCNNIDSDTIESIGNGTHRSSKRGKYTDNACNSNFA